MFEKKGFHSAGKTLRNILFFFVVSVFSSQCFSQSSVSDSSALKSSQYKKKMEWMFDYIQNNYVDEVDPEVLYQGALKGMLSSLNDPYTVYLDTSTKRDLTDTTAGSFGGVGLTIWKPSASKEDKPAYVEVQSPIQGTPGAKAGILSGDYITAIDGKPTPTMTMEDVLTALRGEPGTPVVLAILRGKTMNFNVTLNRALIEVPTVEFGMIGSTGYMRIIEFTPDTAHRVQDALDSFAKNDYKNLIVDLRDNPGGLITSAVDVADKFIDEGPIVSTKSRVLFQNSVFEADKQRTKVPHGLPIVVLINHGSASAAEILSGALKDDHIAYLVGQRSYGKGSVQQVFNLGDSDGMKMTMARYYTPSDTNIDKIGIPPDREVLFPKMSDDEEKLYVKLIDSNVIASYVEKHSGMSEKDIADYAALLQKTYPLDIRLLRRVVRLQVNRLTGIQLYDLDYDVQLNAALDILRKENFDELMKTTKTLKQLQNESEAAGQQVSAG